MYSCNIFKGVREIIISKLYLDLVTGDVDLPSGSHVLKLCSVHASGYHFSVHLLSMCSGHWQNPQKALFNVLFILCRRILTSTINVSCICSAFSSNGDGAFLRHCGRVEIPWAASC